MGHKSRLRKLGQRVDMLEGAVLQLTVNKGIVIELRRSVSNAEKRFKTPKGTDTCRRASLGRVFDSIAKLESREGEVLGNADSLFLRKLRPKFEGSAVISQAELRKARRILRKITSTSMAA